MKKGRRLHTNIKVSNTHILTKAQELGILDILPQWKLSQLQMNPPPLILSGPYPTDHHYTEFHRVFGTSISTYPQYSHSKTREGDPICDGFRLHFFPNVFLVCVSDGCNWGERPREASNRAKDSFTAYVEKNLGEVSSFDELGPILVSGLDAAHQAIIVDKEDVWMAGTSTILGALCLQISDPDANTEWAFVGVSLGDCKTFLWNEKEHKVTDLTEGNRMNITDPRDPGGRIGPYVGNGEADLRNLTLFYSPCSENDILLILSDGVHDNLDPQTLGKSPSDVSVDGDTWEETDVTTGTKAKTEYMCNLLKKFILDENNETLTPKLITKRVLKYCLDLTAPSREHMEQNPSIALSNDYMKFPGKMDHTTCVAFKVGIFDFEKEKEREQDFLETLDPKIWPF